MGAAMKIDQTAPRGPVGGPRGPERASRDGAFTARLAAASTPKAPPGPAPSAPLTSLASLLAVQAVEPVEDATAQRKRALRRAERLLDGLDALRLAYLEGRVGVELLHRLRAELAQARDRPGDGDSRPQELVREVETRVAVELAKLEP